MQLRYTYLTQILIELDPKLFVETNEGLTIKSWDRFFTLLLQVIFSKFFE